jgi:8-oxo-dGTP diphosphatase
MSYTYKYPRPAVTVDCLIFTSQTTPSILLIERKNPPFQGDWALPGGFVEMDEDLYESAQRELEEETGLTKILLNQLYTFGKPGRDPRGRTISVAYYGFIQSDKKKENAVAGSDAKNLKWFSLENLPPLAFDHEEIIQMARKKIEI